MEKEEMKKQGGKRRARTMIAICKEKSKMVSAVEKSFAFSMVTTLKECNHLEVLAAHEALRF